MDRWTFLIHSKNYKYPLDTFKNFLKYHFTGQGSPVST